MKPARLTALIAALICTGSVLAPAAQAQKVGNPTNRLSAIIGSGTFDVGSNHTSFTGPITLFHDATITKDGTINVPLADFNPVKIPVPDQSGTSGPCNYTLSNASVTVTPTADGTGSLNPFTGLATLDVQFYLKGEYTLSSSCFSSYSPQNCQIGSQASPLQLQLTSGSTSPPSGTNPIQGKPYSDSTGRFEVVDNTFALPASDGCDPSFDGLSAPSGTFDSQFGLPSLAGSNTLIASGHLNPVIVRGVRARLVATPTSGLAPLVVSFDATGSKVPAGARSYAFAFGDGTHSTGHSATISHTYSKPGVYTISLTVTDVDWDANTVKRTVTVSRSCIVPKLIGKQISAAETAIHGAGCTVGSVTKQSSSQAKGDVLSQHPAPGAKLAAGSAVSLVVSRGS